MLDTFKKSYEDLEVTKIKLDTENPIYDIISLGFLYNLYSLNLATSFAYSTIDIESRRESLALAALGIRNTIAGLGINVEEICPLELSATILSVSFSLPKDKAISFEEYTGIVMDNYMKTFKSESIKKVK